jgi:protein-disulfide isomerase
MLSIGLVWADDLTPEQQYLIDERIAEQLDAYFASEAFQKEIQQGIIRFVEEQNRLRTESQARSANQRMQNVIPLNDQDYVYGDPDARFTLIEYSDFECPFCKKFHVTAEAFIDQNPDVNWVYRHFPLDFHNPGAQKQAEAAECAGELSGNAGFWRYSKAIFERTRSNGKGFPIRNLVPLANELGMDSEEFGDCLNSEKYREKVLSQYKEGQEAGVTGTPGNFLRDNLTGQTLPVHGAQPLSSLVKALQQLKEE